MPANVAAHHIIKKPLVTEKGTFAMNELTKYTFLVDPRATKTEIKDAVQSLYKVRVIGINTTLRQARTRTTKSGKVDGTITKKAVIRLHADDAIELS